MGPDNLAIVFTPALLRCSSDNAMEVLANNAAERDFVRSLILSDWSK